MGGHAFVSSHAEERSRERLGLDASAANNQATRALEAGLPFARMTGRLRKYVHGLMSHKGVRLYGLDLFIFNGRTLVTVWPVPPEVRATATAQWNEPTLPSEGAAKKP